MQNPTPRKGRPVGPRLQLDVAALNRLRAAAGLTVPELARLATIGTLTLKANIADGEISAYAARRLANVLDCPPAWIARPPQCRTCGQYMADAFGAWDETGLAERTPDDMGPAQ